MSTSPFDASPPLCPTPSPTPATTTASGLLPCDYISFGCVCTFLTSSELNTHLMDNKATHKHLLLIQKSYIELHDKYDKEKDRIKKERAELNAVYAEMDSMRRELAELKEFKARHVTSEKTLHSSPSKAFLSPSGPTSNDIQASKSRQEVEFALERSEWEASKLAYEKRIDQIMADKQKLLDDNTQYAAQLASLQCVKKEHDELLLAHHELQSKFDTHQKESEEEITEFQLRQVKFKNEAEQHRKEMRAVLDAHRDSEQQRSALDSQLHGLNAKLSELTRYKLTLEEEKALWLDKNQELMEQLKKHNDQRSLTQSDAAQLQQRFDALSLNYSTLQLEHQECDATHKALQTAQTQSENQIHQLQSQHAAMSSQLSATLLDSQHLRSELSDLKSEKEMLRQHSANLQSKLDELNKSHLALQQAHDGASSASSSLEQQELAHSQARDDWRVKEEQLTATITTLRARVSELETMNANQENKIKSHRANIEQCQKEHNDKLESMSRQHTQQIEQLEADFRQRESKLVAADAAHQLEVVQLSAKFQNQLADHEAMSNELKYLKQKHLDTAQYDKVLGELQALQSEKDQWLELKKQAEDQMEQLLNLSQQQKLSIQAHEAKLGELNATIQSLSNEKAAAQAELAHQRASDQSSLLQAKVSELESQNAALVIKVSELEAIIAQMEQQKLAFVDYKKAMEVKLMKYEKNYTPSPLDSMTLPTTPVPSNPSTPRASQPSQSPHSSPSTAAMVPRMPNNAAPQTPVIQPSQYITDVQSDLQVMKAQRSGNLSNAEKRLFLLEKVHAYEITKQQLQHRLDQYLGSELLYFEVHIVRGTLSPPMAPPSPSRFSSSAGALSNSLNAQAPKETIIQVQDNSKSAIFIGMGVKSQQVINAQANTPSHLPGYLPHSFSYCSINGHVYDGREDRVSTNTSVNAPPPRQREFAYGPTYSKGDVIGCGWDVSRRTVFFTRNGIYLGTALYDVDVLNYSACVGIVSEFGGEQVSINFGSSPFLYRGLPLPAPAFNLDKQHFLYRCAPCAGVELGDHTSLISLSGEKGDEEHKEHDSMRVVTMSQSLANPSRSPSVGVIFSAQSLLPVLSLSITLSQLAPLLSAEYPSIHTVFLQAYLKDSPIGNFKSVAQGDKIPLSVIQQGQPLTLNISLPFQSHPACQLMVLCSGLGAGGQSVGSNTTMIGIGDEIIDVGEFVRHRDDAVCCLTKEGRPLQSAVLVYRAVRVTGGRPNALSIGGSKNSNRYESSVSDLYFNNSPQPSPSPSLIASSPPALPDLHPLSSSPPGGGPVTITSPPQAALVPHPPTNRRQSIPLYSRTNSHSASPPPNAANSSGLNSISTLGAIADQNWSRQNSRSVSSGNGVGLAARAISDADDDASVRLLFGKLFTIQSHIESITARLQQVREEVAGYLENQDWKIFDDMGTDPRTRALAVPSSNAGGPSPTKMKKSIVGVGPVAESELDMFVHYGKGAYHAIYLVHVMLHLNSRLRVSNLRELIQLIQAQQQRLDVCYAERQRKHDEQIDQSCLFQ